MPLSLRLVLLLGFVILANLPASTVLTCGTDPAALTSSGCYSLATFSLNETLDWQAAYGTAVYSPGDNLGARWDVTSASGPWMALPTASGLVVGATFGPTATGSIFRYDNFYDPTQVGPVRSQPGMFDLGDHLLTATDFGAGALELQFSRGISGALFRISTPNSTNSSADMTATIAAYSVANPSASDVPIMTYRINAPYTDSGICVGLQNNQPCNTAPYIGIEGGMLNIRSLVIYTNDPGGIYIGTLFIDESPEPGTFALTGVVGILAILGRRRMLRDRRT